MAKNNVPQLQIRVEQSPTDPLVDALEARLFPRLHEKIMEGLASKIWADSNIPKSPKRLFSLKDIAEIFGVGRTEATRLIREGKMQCTERRCRGGKIGVFVAVEEAERVLVGIRKS